MGDVVGDIVIRDVPDDIVRAIDTSARRLGLPRNEYVRRLLARDAAAGVVQVHVDDLRRFALAFAELGDPALMERAWD